VETKRPGTADTLWYDIPQEFFEPMEGSGDGD